ncbi:hypothetical protein CLU79DRAFT_832538 [Phycomyces nitens]|nr:hypothetical protein CLU79DRAFT_832538 [Phycomyces nitens]
MELTKESNTSISSTASTASIASQVSAFDKGTNTRFIGKTTSGTLCYVGHASLQWSIGQVPNGGKDYQNLRNRPDLETVY